VVSCKYSYFTERKEKRGLCHYCAPGGACSPELDEICFFCQILAVSGHRMGVRKVSASTSQVQVQLVLNCSFAFVFLKGEGVKNRSKVYGT